MTNLLFCMTMDCERIKPESPPGGPPDWGFSRRAIEGFRSVLAEEGVRGTFFIVPENAARHVNVWQGMDPEAFELGLHLHPQSLGDRSHDEYLGAYSADAQCNLIQAASDAWTQALGRRPLAFRPGNFSANDATFGVLSELGFTHGSVSSPGRCMPGFRAVWSGADPYVHRSHPYFRLIGGGLEFVEAPVAEDLTRFRLADPQRALPHELRVEWGDAASHGLTIRNCLSAMLDARPPVLAIVGLTHNHEDYFSRDSCHVASLRAIIRHARQAAADHGLEFTPATIGQIRQALLDATEDPQKP